MDLPTLDDDFCGRHTGLARTGRDGGIMDFVQQPLNVAKFTAEGCDLEAIYQLDTSRFADNDAGCSPSACSATSSRT